MRFFSVGLIPKLLCFQGQRPEVCLAQPIGLVTPMQLKTVRANGPAICQFSLAISKRLGRWPYNLSRFRFPGRWPGLGKHWAFGPTEHCGNGN